MDSVASFGRGPEINRSPSSGGGGEWVAEDGKVSLNGHFLVDGRQNLREAGDRVWKGDGGKMMSKALKGIVLSLSKEVLDKTNECGSVRSGKKAVRSG